jgi:hypothetical protein
MMPQAGRVSRVVAVIGSVMFASIGVATVAQTGDKSSSTAYSPVAPATSLLVGVRLNLKIVGDWLDQNDFASARDTADGVAVLADLCMHQSVEASWRERTDQLRKATRQLVAHTRDKNAAASAETLKQCLDLTDEMRRSPPTGDKAVLKDFRAVIPNRTLMKIMDGTYSDMKGARSTADLADLAYTLAEVSNVLRFLRGDAPWQEQADAMRDAALRVATTAPDADLKTARAELKIVLYSRCEACHQSFKR